MMKSSFRNFFKVSTTNCLFSNSHQDDEADFENNFLIFHLKLRSLN